MFELVGMRNAVEEPGRHDDHILEEFGYGEGPLRDLHYD